MDFQTTSKSLLDWSGDGLGFGLFEEATELTADLAQLNQRVAGNLADLIIELEFKGKEGSTGVLRVGSQGPVRKLLLIGLGKQGDFGADKLRRASATLARLARKEKLKTLALSLPLPGGDQALAAQMMVEGVELGLYQDQRFKSEPEDKSQTPEAVVFLGLEPQAAAIAKGQAMAAGVNLARQLVAAPANVVNPVTLAQTAADIAAQGGLSLEVLEQEECEKFGQGMGAFLGVARASDLPPKFIHLTYKPTGTPRRKLAIVGKGLTFDSGGLNLKVAGSGIETMKMDMGGAAAVLGAAQVIGQLQPDVEVHFISAVTENMISGRALHPGDVLTAANGKTIEVGNTDAEGRLTLADALVFTESLKVDAIVDLATLTGACVVALGDEMAGLWSTSKTLQAELLEAAELAGEKLWPMPLEEKYLEGIKSPIADWKNVGPRGGGAITAALFLKQFVQETPWAHLDVAGPVWADKENGCNGAGATGYGVRTLVNWVMSS